jgi:hypothetical protein
MGGGLGARPLCGKERCVMSQQGQQANELSKKLLQAFANSSQATIIPIKLMFD